MIATLTAGALSLTLFAPDRGVQRLARARLAGAGEQQRGRET